MALPDKLRRMTDVAVAITRGDPKKWPNLKCPHCETANLIFSFTRMRLHKPPWYGLYFVCRHCGESAHFTLGERPPNFREDLVIAKFQRLEDEVARQVEEDMEQEQVKD